MTAVCRTVTGARMPRSRRLWTTRRRMPARLRRGRTRSAAERLQPRPTRLERFGGLRDRPPCRRTSSPPRVRPRASRSRPSADASCRSRAPSVSGLLRFQSASSRVRSACSILRSSSSSARSGVAREDAADLVPATLDAGEERTRLRDLALVGDGLRLFEQRALRLDLLAGGFGIGGLALDAGAVQRVAGGLEPRPERVVDLLAGATGRLPLVEQVAVGGDAVLALRRERLGLLDETRLAVANALVRLVELGVELAAVLVDRRARVAESLPELLRGRLRQARAVLLLRLPLRRRARSARRTPASTARSAGRGRRAPRPSRRARCGSRTASSTASRAAAASVSDAAASVSVSAATRATRLARSPTAAAPSSLRVDRAARRCAGPTADAPPRR